MLVDALQKLGHTSKEHIVCQAEVFSNKEYEFNGLDWETDVNRFDKGM